VKFEIKISKVYLMAVGGIVVMLIALIGFILTCRAKGGKSGDSPKGLKEVYVEQEVSKGYIKSPPSTASEDESVNARGKKRGFGKSD